MRMIRKKSVILCTVLVVLCALFLKIELPDGLEDSLKVRLICFKYTIFWKLGDLMEDLGASTQVRTVRWWVDFGVSLAPRTEEKDIEYSDIFMDEVPVRLYKPRKTDPRGHPGIIFFHGGGWFFGSVESHHRLTKMLARDLNAVVVSVEYRLAPEHPYPAPLNDCVHATLSFFKNATRLGVDPKRIALAGDSAGGNFVAAVALILRDMKSAFMPKIQVMMHPLLQALDFDVPSHRNNDEAVFFTRRMMARATLHYMGFNSSLDEHLITNRHIPKNVRQQYERFLNLKALPRRFLENYTLNRTHNHDEHVWRNLERYVTDPYFSPLLAKDLSCLPKAYIATGEHDVLRDDGIFYAHRLKEEGVDVTWSHYEHGFHGDFYFSEGIYTITSGVKLMSDLIQFLKKEL